MLKRSAFFVRISPCNNSKPVIVFLFLVCLPLAPLLLSRTCSLSPKLSLRVVATSVFHYSAPSDNVDPGLRRLPGDVLGRPGVYGFF